MHPPILTLIQIATAVAEIEAECQLVPGLILSENDLQCLLFERLRTTLRTQNQICIQTDNEHIRASPIHTEIKIFDENLRLILRPDIIVMSPGSLSLVNDDEVRLIARKGFVLFGSAVFIELKFAKFPKGIDLKETNKIAGDCQKLDGIKQRLYPNTESADMIGCVVVFNRTDVRCEAFNNLAIRQANSTTSKIIYATGRFQPADA